MYILYNRRSYLKMKSIDLEFEHVPVYTVHKDAEDKIYNAVWGAIVPEGKQDDENGEESA
jgi:hypothetical protein